MFQSLYEHLVEGEKPNPEDIFKSVSAEEYLQRVPPEILELVQQLQKLIGGRLRPGDGGQFGSQLKLVGYRGRLRDLQKALDDVGFTEPRFQGLGLFTSGYLGRFQGKRIILGVEIRHNFHQLEFTWK